MKLNMQNLQLTEERLAHLKSEVPDWVQAIDKCVEIGGKQEVATHYTTFGGNADLLQIALVYADHHRVRVLFATTLDAYMVQASDRTAGNNMHHNAMPAEDFRYEIDKRMKKEGDGDGKRP